MKMEKTVFLSIYLVVKATIKNNCFPNWIISQIFGIKTTEPPRFRYDKCVYLYAYII